MLSKIDYIWNAKILQEALGVSVDQNLLGGKLQINSLDVENGDIFIAMQGRLADGHDYVFDAIKRGANFVIVNKVIPELDEDKFILVSNTLEALNLLAEYKRKNSKAIFIGITGSVGKTSTKEAALSAFRNCGETFASRGNFNNELGLLINLASMTDSCEYAIFELGMNNIGEIKKLSLILKPDIAIINNVYNTHLANFKDLNQIAAAKAEIFQGLDKNHGVAILPKDNAFYQQLKDAASLMGVEKIYDFSFHGQASGSIKNINFENISIEVLGEIFNINTRSLPSHHLYNFVPVILTATILKCNMDKIIEGLDNYKISSGRGNLISVKKMDFTYSIIDDSYNSSPASLRAAIKNLDQTSARRKIIVIGDMLELGAHEEQEHINFANILNNTTIDIVITYGNLANKICSFLTKKFFSYIDIEILNQELYSMITRGDIVLVKSSKSIGLNLVVKFLTKLS